MSFSSSSVSYWHQNPSCSQLSFEQLSGDHHTDALVVGAGVTGLSVALELAHRGVRTTVCEATAFGSGSSAMSTGHLDNQPPWGIRCLQHAIGTEAAAEYLHQRNQAIAAIEYRAADRCDFVRVPSYTYGESDAEINCLREEFDTATVCNAKPRWRDSVPLPFAAAGYEVRQNSRVGVVILDHDADSYAIIARSFDGEPEGLTRDDILDNITLYWLTNTAISSARLYWEHRQTAKAGFFDAKGITIPVGVSANPSEIYTAPKSWTERAFPKLLHYGRLPKGCHFMAWEQPKYFTDEVRIVQDVADMKC